MKNKNISRLCGAVFGLASVFGTPALAESPAHCRVLGQMALSTWLELLNGLTAAQSSTQSPVIARMSDLTDSYDNLDCDTEALGVAMSCLMERAGEGYAMRDLAQKCMTQAGISG